MKMKTFILLLLVLLGQQGCSSHKREIFFASLLGAAAGAGAGYAFGYHGPHGQDATRNTIISAAVVSLISAGAMAWHYREVDQAIVELSGKYSRYRLVDSASEAAVDPSRFLDSNRAPKWLPEQVGKYSVLLDQTTRWVLPVFNKRWLAPEAQDDQLVSSHYVWEIHQPGYFISQEKNPDLFEDLAGKEKK